MLLLGAGLGRHPRDSALRKKSSTLGSDGVHGWCRRFGLKRSVKICRLPPPAAFRVPWGAGPQLATGFFARHIIAVPRISLISDPESLQLNLPDGTLVTECHGPPGVADDAAVRLLAEAVARPAHGPPLAAHVVPGDRVVVAIAGSIPQPTAVRRAVAECLDAAGVEPDGIAFLQAAPLDDAEPYGDAGGPVGERFDPGPESATAYLAADAAARPLYLARQLVDADVVVAIGGFGWDAAVGGRSLEGELWPCFGRDENRRQLVVGIARRGRAALVDWRSALHDITWQLGVCASLRLVAGRSGSLHAARFGLPEEAARLARDAADAWRPAVHEPADLTVATLSAGRTNLGAAIRAIAAAARATHPEGTICVVGPIQEPPGIVLSRWRQGAPLLPLVREAVASRDDALVADAVHTRQLARALGERRLVLQCGLEESVVEDLGFGHAAGPEAIERLAHRADHVLVLHEADRMLPRI